MKKVLFISIIALLGTGLFSGCKNDKDQTYLYAIGIDGYEYDGSTLLGPMLYLESLGIAKSLSIVSTDQQDADKQAIVRFDAEMGKIDAATLASYGNTVYVRYVLQTLGEEQTTLHSGERIRAKIETFFTAGVLQGKSRCCSIFLAELL